MRLIDADEFIETCRSILDMQDTWLPIHIKDLVIDEMPTVDAVPVIRCKDCGQREYGCSTFIDHNQIYGFCAWGWKAERKEE